jgi:type III secretion protein N (ATPase)
VKLDALRAHLEEVSSLNPQGRVEAVVGLSVRVRLAQARIGDVVQIHKRGSPLMGEVVGIDGPNAIVMALGELSGVGVDDAVQSTSAPFQIRVSEKLLGRVINGLGVPIDGKPLVADGPPRSVDHSPPTPLERAPVSKPLATGVRVIDGLLTLGEGQRMGLFAGSGVGKSTLLGAIARGTAADIVVVALVGERGREVGEFLEQSLGETGLAKSVVVVATSDAPALERLRAAQVATTIAEGFRDRGLRVMLLVDSVTRFARAQREVGLAAGEPPARRGYPPSVFAMLPRLLERSGQAKSGSITAIYTVLVEGGDMDEPIADEVRGILDGHIVLDRTIASRGRYPAVDVLASLSRVMSGIVPEQHKDAAQRVRKIMATFEAKRDLISMGAYHKGTDRELDVAIGLMPKVEKFLGQNPNQIEDFQSTVGQLLVLR